MSSEEYGVALEAFKVGATGGTTTLQWPTFKLALHYMLTSGIRLLSTRRVVLAEELVLVRRSASPRSLLPPLFEQVVRRD